MTFDKSDESIVTDTDNASQHITKVKEFDKQAKQKLSGSIDTLPTNWKFTPVFNKVPKRKNWQHEEPISREILKNELNKDNWNGIGLRTGEISGGLLTIDVDGPTAVILINGIEATYETLPETVSWASGKEGRRQLLFQIPDKYRDLFKDKGSKAIHEFASNGELLKCATDEKGRYIEEVDFRYNGHQSVLPPSFHPQTGSYHWITSPNNCKVAIAPDWLCEFILKVFEGEPQQKKNPSKFDYSIFNDADKNIHDEWINTIPVEVLVWHEYRNLLLALHYEGYSETEALSISQTSSKHTDKGFYDIWTHIKDDKSRNITGGTLYHLAVTYGNWEPKKSDKKEWAKKQIEYKTKTVVESINKEGNLSNQLSQLLDTKDDESIILKASIELARKFEEPIDEITEWVEKDFKNLPKKKIWTAINIVAAIATEWGDKAIIAFLSQSIKEKTGLPQIREIRSAFHSVRREMNPPKKDKEIKFEIIESRITGLAFNQLSKKVERDGKEYKNIELAYISEELRDSEIEISKDFAVDSILSIALKDSYHPVKNYLESIRNTPVLPDDEWDNLASILLGAKDELSQIILKKSLIAAVARVYRPGCYVRMIVVLQGMQNKGKSTFLRLLAGDEFFCDSLGKLDNPKDDYQLLHSYWIHEWGEIDKLNKKSSGEVKAFITKTKDDYRAPYARSPETHARQCVIFGTCNRIDFLQDPTGNTRYSVIPIGNVDLEKTKELRDRIWATAMSKFEAGISWELSEVEQALSEKNNENFTASDPWLEYIESFIQYRNEVSINEILENLEIEKSKRDSMSSKRVRDCLMILGWAQDKNATIRAGKRDRRFRPALSQPSQEPDIVHDTVQNEVCQDCVDTVSAERLTVEGLQDSDTVDTVKIKEITPPYVSQKSEQKETPAFWGGNNIENQCVNCVSTPESLTQQAIALTHNSTHNCVPTQNDPDQNFKVGDRVLDPTSEKPDDVLIISQIFNDGIWAYCRSEEWGGREPHLIKNLITLTDQPAIAS